MDAPDTQKRAQIVKWVVYALLLVNFGYYFVEELYIAAHVLHEGSSLADWSGAFATTLDELGWFTLLLLFELETYQISDQALERRIVRWPIHGVRVLCYVLLAHTVFQWMNNVLVYNEVSRATEVSSLCDVAGQDISFGRNFRYTLIDESNCAELSDDDRYYFIEPTVITDRAGYELEGKLLWVDLNDACVWLIVVLLIELAVRFQNRGVTGAPLTIIGWVTTLLYGVLFAHALFWLWTGHWLYAWDQTVWITGFWIIGRNLSEWREEMKEMGR